MPPPVVWSLSSEMHGLPGGRHEECQQRQGGWEYHLRDFLAMVRLGGVVIVKRRGRDEFWQDPCWGIGVSSGSSDIAQRVGEGVLETMTRQSNPRVKNKPIGTRLENGGPEELKRLLMVACLKALVHAGRW